VPASPVRSTTARPTIATAARKGLGRGPTRGLGATLVLAVALAGCASGRAVMPSSSPSRAVHAGSPSASSSSAAGPSTGSAGADAPTAPDVSPDPIDPSTTLPPFVPPAQLTTVAAGLVLHVPVLMYHRIIPPSMAGRSLPGLVVPPARFAAQMDALAGAGWHTITAAKLLSDLAGGIQPAPRTFVITFDDGYDDGYTYALPILEAHGFVATFYVIAGRIGDPPGPYEALTPQHVLALAQAGMEIGNHTFSHVDLATSSPLLRRYEVVSASARIQSLIGTAPTTLAYPYGRWNAAAVGQIRAAGIGMAFTTVEGAREVWATRYASPRVRVSPSTTPAELLALVRRFGGTSAGG
jgi:peptidoglycan/xylan/chitin deacetylase (PgdA/CDA1 family)